MRTSTLLRPLVAASTYRGAAFILSGLPLGVAWLTLVVTGWSVGIGLIPAFLIGLPVLLAFGYVCRGALALERGLANVLIDAGITGPAHRPLTGGLIARLRGWLGDPATWCGQAYLLLRFVVGVPFATLLLAAAGWSAAHMTAPLWYWAPDPEDSGLGFGAWWRVDSFGEALLAMLLGLVGVVATAHLIRPLAAAARVMARGLLGGEPAPAPPVGAPRPRRGIGATLFRGNVATAVLLSLVALAVWALATPGGYFWPGWVMLGMAFGLAIHAIARYGCRWPARHRALIIHAAVWGALWLYLVGAWALTRPGGYFWPMWVLIPVVLAVGGHAAVAYSRRGARIDELTTSRAGAVDVQAAELRRIERDLHDGAQARLVALNMNLGMAEQKLGSDPDAALALVGEARDEARRALVELRDLARGISPPMLADRGLQAAVEELAVRSAVPVTVSAQLGDRPVAAVENAAYFTVAEALTNAAKHSGATRVDVRLRRTGDTLTVEVEDDGAGGADPQGSGITGLRRRVEALDGRIAMESPPGGGTRLRAELPCGS